MSRKSKTAKKKDKKKPFILHIKVKPNLAISQSSLEFLNKFLNFVLFS